MALVPSHPIYMYIYLYISTALLFPNCNNVRATKKKRRTPAFIFRLVLEKESMSAPLNKYTAHIYIHIHTNTRFPFLCFVSNAPVFYKLAL